MHEGDDVDCRDSPQESGDMLRYVVVSSERRVDIEGIICSFQEVHCIASASASAYAAQNWYEIWKIDFFKVNEVKQFQDRGRETCYR